MEDKHPKPLQQIALESRYPLDAFHFVRRGLDYTVHLCHHVPEELSEDNRHVTGQQLSEGLRDFAIKQYGCLTRTVLKQWNLNRTEDFGRIVFAMVNGGLMQAQETDSVRDFDNCFDFEEAFDVDIPLDNLQLDDPAMSQDVSF